MAFTSAYAGNLRKIAVILGQMQERLDVQKVAVAEELTHLLGHSEYYGNAAQKQHILNDYQQLCAHANSGKTVDLPVNALQDDLNQKADWMMEHIRKTEWVTDGVGNGWLNGYYDDHGEQVEGLVHGTVRMMLPSQVFAIMSGTADEEQVRDICASADHYLYERTIGGYRLNTDFHEEKFDLPFVNKNNDPVVCILPSIKLRAAESCSCTENCAGKNKNADCFLVKAIGMNALYWF